MNLKEKYGSFKSIVENSCKASCKKEFWEKERNNITIQIKKGKKERESMLMSINKFKEPFTI